MMVRNWIIQIRMSQSEKEDFRLLATGAGFATLSAYVRHCCLERPFWLQGKLVQLGDALEEIRVLLDQRTKHLSSGAT
jgi:hypothetical protein